MKKGRYLLLLVVLFVGLTGCKEEKPEEGTITERPVTNDTKFVSEDYEPGNRSYYMPRAMMRTENGFYHYNYAEGSLYYYDAASGKEMYLCNKPECRHDGNPFCVATNDKYQMLGCCLYDNSILAYVLEETQLQYLLKVFSIALDGSTMDEIATVFTLEKAGQKLDFFSSEVHAHRNKVMITMAGCQPELTDTFRYGTAILDLDTGGVTFLDEEPLSKENIKITDITAYGDYFYYCKKEGKKTILHRYHITAGTVETCKLLTGFRGSYVVLNEDTVVYLKGGGTTLCTYQYSTGENEEKIRLQRIHNEYEFGTVVGGHMSDYTAQDILTDGTYLYIPESTTRFDFINENGEAGSFIESYLHVFNQQLEEITSVNMAEILPEPEEEVGAWHVEVYTRGLRYLGEDIYWCLVSDSNPDLESYVFHCKRSDFLTGKPKFTFVYKYTEGR